MKPAMDRRAFMKLCGLGVAGLSSAWIEYPHANPQEIGFYFARYEYCPDELPDICFNSDNGWKRINLGNK